MQDPRPKTVAFLVDQIQAELRPFGDFIDSFSIDKQAYSSSRILKAVEFLHPRVHLRSMDSRHGSVLLASKHESLPLREENMTAHLSIRI